MDPSRAALYGRLGAHIRWQRNDPTTGTEPARKAFLNGFASRIRDQYPDLPDQEVERRAKHARAEHFTRLAIASVESRSKKKAAGPIKPTALEVDRASDPTPTS